MKRQKMRRMPFRNKKGLTLIELVVAFALLAIVAMMMSGAIVYIFQTSIWTSDKTEVGLNTVGELVDRANGGTNSTDVSIEIVSRDVTFQFEGLSPFSIAVDEYTATSEEIPRNGSRQEVYKVFTP